MDKLKMHSPNLTEDNIARIREMFPGCVTEARGEDGSVKLYRAAGWMIRQAEEFKWVKRDLDREGVRVFVHGRGLLPDIAKALRDEELAA